LKALLRPSTYNNKVPDVVCGILSN
jgi:hypothetical protein